ncbi:MAG: hypothetical protein HY965_08335 [Ignavibacteriales bacterium]|nr:hypothetical protein [Ignavibacteriales bacterium]
MKKGFRNYNFDFDKNERRILSTFCKQVIKQTGGDQKYYPVEKAFAGILAKLDSGEDTIRLTKDEYMRLAEHLKENIRHLKTKIDKTWFLMKWLYKSMLNQYQLMLNTHFKD